MFGLNPLQFIFRLLIGADQPRAVAGGLAIGFFIGLTPGWPLHILLACLLLLILNVNISAAMIAMGLAVSLSWLFDPVINAIGSLFLQDIQALHSFWTWAYNNPVLAWTRFNNTMVMGALISGGISAILIATVGASLLIKYQTSWVAKLKNFKVFKWLQRSILARAYAWLAGGA